VGELAGASENLRNLGGGVHALISVNLMVSLASGIIGQLIGAT